MDKIKLFWAYSAGPDVKSASLIFFENLLQELKKNIDPHLVWLVYQPEKKIIKQTHSDIHPVYIQDYKDALDVLKKEKPDIVFSTPWSDIMSYSFLLAARNLDIPVLSFIFSDLGERRSLSLVIKSYIVRFFESSIPTDTAASKKQFMRRGRFFINKYFFLVKTQKSVGMSRFKVIQEFFMFLKLFLTETKGHIDARFANDLHFVEGELMLKPYLDAGFKNSSLILTGNPVFDSTFQKFLKPRAYERKDGKIHVLFAHSTLYEHGFWNKKQRDYVVTEIVKEIMKNKHEIALTVKIHPSTSVLSQYEELVHSIDPSIPVYQKGDIRDFLDDTDVYISSEASSGELFTLISKKPIIICRFFKEIRGDALLENGLALQCTDPKDLVQMIHESVSSNPATEEKRAEFIKKYMYKDDGLAAARISREIIKFMEKSSQNYRNTNNLEN